MRKLKISEKITKVIEKEGITIYTLEKKIGVSNGTLRKAIEKNSDSLLKYINKIAKEYPEYENFLKTESTFTDISESENTDNQNNIIKKSENTYNKNTYKSFYGKNAFYIPVQAMTVFLNSITSNSMIKDLSVIKLPPEYDTVNFVFTVEGNSMYSTFSNGDHVGCRYIDNKKYIRYGEPYIIDIGDGALLLKRIHPCETDDNKIVLRSDNFGYDDMPILRNDIQHLFQVTTKLSKDVDAHHFVKQIFSITKTLDEINNKLLQA